MSTEAPIPRVRRRVVRVEAAEPAVRVAAGASGLDAFRAWFASRGWTTFPFQEEAWGAFARGESGLINVPTGAGKTYAAYGGPLADLIDETKGSKQPRGLRVLYITPPRAVARDIELALRLPVLELGLKLRVEG